MYIQKENFEDNENENQITNIFNLYIKSFIKIYLGLIIIL